MEAEIKAADIAKIAAKEKQDFMENLIQTVSPNLLFKSQEDHKMSELSADGGIKELKEKYDGLRAQGPSLGF
jgi:hypothetical protein